jgi:formylglycine-generating enzyme required for sulfatase activity
MVTAMLKKLIIAIFILLFISTTTWAKDKSGGKCPDKMSFIPGGVFLAGDVDSLKDMSINAFCMDKFEVTQAEYERVVGNNPSNFDGGNFPSNTNHPVETVNWYEAKTYCEKVGKRLPTEWEWEKAAKSGTTTKYYWGNDPSSKYAWYDEDWKRGHHTVGQKKPNAFGLYDMSGNVWEWTSSDYDSGTKVLRGGSWLNNPVTLRSAFRDRNDPSERNYGSGFRCSQ